MTDRGLLKFEPRPAVLAGTLLAATVAVPATASAERLGCWARPLVTVAQASAAAPAERQDRRSPHAAVRHDRAPDSVVREPASGSTRTTILGRRG